jgi:site-specific recombinase XerD
MNEQTTPRQLQQYLAELALQGKPQTTIKSYGYDLLAFSRFFESVSPEPFSAAAITPTDIRDYRAELLSTDGRKLATINRRLAALRSFFSWAQAEGLVQESPVERIKGVQTQQQAPKWIQRREAHRLLRAVERAGNKRDLAIASILYYTGLRVRELTSLRLVDLELSERRGVLTIRAGKGGKFRLVPLNGEARAVLKDYLAVRPHASDDHLFLGQRGTGIMPRMVEYLLAKYARLAGLEGVTPHTLRHTAAKGLLDAGVSLEKVASILGHQRLQTTALYTTPSFSNLEQAVARLERE